MGNRSIMTARSDRLERRFVAVLAVIGVANIILNVVLGQMYIGTLLTNLLVLGLLGLAVEVLYRYGINKWWTITAGVLLVLGGVIDAVVTLIGLPGVLLVVPKVIWGTGLLLVIYKIFSNPSDIQATNTS